ncbi:NADH:flavin oxidoreductase [Parasphingopyxis sp. GrpM-11]|uniref:NADH:flavin oxidoreductase n=2 Tax=Parasphingopyxis marina TaxID=2761622 RepID=A0A842HVB2_9SPHN|nr:NADH:flavin oxidoreductase [Parasphingopyxis marina]
MSAESLFTPFTIKSLSLPNRIVMAPMTRSFSPGGIPTDDVAAYYRRRAEGGVGLIFTEGTAIERPAAKSNDAHPDFFGHGLTGWSKVFEAVHSAGGRIAPQLWHVGSVHPEEKDGNDPNEPIDSPSGIRAPEGAFGQPMTEEMIQDTIDAFAASARHAQKIGADAINIHAAHGYLIDQFFWALTNRRDDRWGGEDIGSRSRFAAEVIRAIRSAVGPDLPIIIRLSQWKQQDYTVRLATTPTEMHAWLEPMADAGIDMFDCSQRRFWEPEFEGSDLNFAGWVKKISGLPTITVGSVGLDAEFLSFFTDRKMAPAPVDELVRRLERGDFDLVAVGRALLGDPHWAEKIREGRASELLAFDRSVMRTLT